MQSDSDEEEKHTLLHGIQRQEGKLTLYLVFVCVVASISGFGNGYYTGVLNNPEKVITSCNLTDTYPSFLGLDLPPCFAIDSALWGTIVGMFAIGGMVGGIIGGPLADFLGRRNLMLFNNIFYFTGSLLLMFATVTPMLIVGRIFVGIGAGVGTVVVPMYVAEISPVQYRGALGVVNQCAVVLGIFVSQTLGLALSDVPGWRWLVGMMFFFSLAQSILLPFCVQTPRWLVMKNRNSEAADALKKLRATVNDSTINLDLRNIVEGQVNSGGNSVGLWQILTDARFRLPLAIAVILQICQQLSGINAVFYYSTSIFEDANPDNAEILTVCVGLLNVLLTFVSLFLMDRAGRRVLLLIGMIGMILVGALYTIAFSLDIPELAIVCTFLYVAAFAVGLGPIPFLIIAEIFPTNALGIAASIAVCVNWTGNYLVGQFFPLMQENLGDYSFLPFSGILFLGMLFTFRYIPETKGKSLEEITKELGN